MISVSDIAKSIKQPQLLQVSELEDLKGYTEKYPFSQLFSILYLKGLSDASDLRFEDELKKHSFRISDRARLYELISDNEQSLEDKKVAKEQVVEKEVHSEPLETEVIKEEAIEEGEKVASTESHIEIDLENEKTIKKPKDQVDESILQHAFAANYQLPELSEEEKNALEEKNISKEIEAEKIPEIEPIEISIDTKQSFNSWLKANSNYEEKENNSPSVSVDIVNDSEPSKSKKEILEDIKNTKTAFFSPTQKAKESLQEDSLPVSETLAKIYALQGNFPKAIEAYSQLSLKYPEKKIFFAIRIKELEKKLNTK